VPEPIASEIELAIENFKRHISPGIDQIQEKLFNAGRRKIRFKSINILFLLVIVEIPGRVERLDHCTHL
jgi:hypothetical protein